MRSFRGKVPHGGRRRTRGYTLLEILVATTILVIGLTAVFGIARTSQKKSVAAADLAAVQLACQSTLNELLARQTPIKPFAPKDLTDVPHWKIALYTYRSSRPGLCVLHLTAQKFTIQGDLPIGAPFHLIRWVAEGRIAVSEQTDVFPETLDFNDPYG